MDTIEILTRKHAILVLPDVLHALEQAIRSVQLAIRVTIFNLLPIQRCAHQFVLSMDIIQTVLPTNAHPVQLDALHVQEEATFNVKLALPVTIFNPHQLIAHQVAQMDTIQIPEPVSNVMILAQLAIKQDHQNVLHVTTLEN